MLPRSRRRDDSALRRIITAMTTIAIAIQTTIATLPPCAQSSVDVRAVDGCAPPRDAAPRELRLHCRPGLSAPASGRCSARAHGSVLGPPTCRNAARTKPGPKALYRAARSTAVPNCTYKTGDGSWLNSPSDSARVVDVPRPHFVNRSRMCPNTVHSPAPDAAPFAGAATRPCFYGRSHADSDHGCDRACPTPATCRSESD
jgi:hypothetical protein